MRRKVISSGYVRIPKTVDSGVTGAAGWADVWGVCFGCQDKTICPDEACSWAFTGTFVQKGERAVERARQRWIGR